MACAPDISGGRASASEGEGTVAGAARLTERQLSDPEPGGGTQAINRARARRVRVVLAVPAKRQLVCAGARASLVDRRPIEQPRAHQHEG